MKTKFIKLNIYTIFFLIIGSFLLLSFSGCTKEKGCTDKSALNYNSIAEENDGSCIFCKLTEKQITSLSVYLVDDYWNSPHYNEQVARFDLVQVSKNYNDQKCGKDECAVAVKIQSLVDKQMEFTYTLNI